MILSVLRVSNFRNHRASTLEFGRGINALVGENGQGKTNLLEAASYLSLTKSFYAASDADVVQLGQERFEVEGVVVSDTNVRHAIRVEYVKTPPTKTFTVNGAAPERLAAVIGRFPVVVLSPENNAITFGAPSERRKFIDLTLSQVSTVYLEDLLEYRRILRQRNRILLDARTRGFLPAGILEPWTENLIRYGSGIAERRVQFVEEFRSYVTAAYGRLVPHGEEPGLTYESGVGSVAGDGATSYADALRRELASGSKEEQRRGATLAGPHRDEVRLTIDGISVKHFASQGQHKTLLVALKVAEFLYVQDRRQEKPIFLLDDVFSELDEHRAQRILAVASELGQSVITSTDDRMFRASVNWNDSNRRFAIAQGTCRSGS